MRQQSAKALADLEARQKGLERELARHSAGLRKLVSANGNGDAARLAELNEQIRVAQQKATVMREQTLKLRQQTIDHGEVAAALSAFDPVWEQLAPREQARVIQLLVERVDYDGR